MYDTTQAKCKQAGFGTRQVQLTRMENGNLAQLKPASNLHVSYGCNIFSAGSSSEGLAAEHASWLPCNLPAPEGACSSCCSQFVAVRRAVYLTLRDGKVAVLIFVGWKLHMLMFEQGRCCTRCQDRYGKVWGEREMHSAAHL